MWAVKQSPEVKLIALQEYIWCHHQHRHIYKYIYFYGGSGACTAVSQQKGHGFDSRMGLCWLWGAGPPQTFSAQVGYLPGLSVWSLHVLPVFTRGFLH